MHEHLWYDATQVHIGGEWRAPAGGGQLDLRKARKGR